MKLFLLNIAVNQPHLSNVTAVLLFVHQMYGVTTHLWQKSFPVLSEIKSFCVVFFSLQRLRKSSPKVKFVFLLRIPSGSFFLLSTKNQTTNKALNRIKWLSISKRKESFRFFLFFYFMEKVSPFLQEWITATNP